MKWINLEKALPPPDILVWVKRVPNRVEEFPIYLAKRPAGPLTHNPDTSKDCNWRGVYARTLKETQQEYSGMVFKASFSDTTVQGWAHIDVPAP